MVSTLLFSSRGPRTLIQSRGILLSLRPWARLNAYWSSKLNRDQIALQSPRTFIPHPPLLLTFKPEGKRK